jgi:general secretion pathway protein E
MQAWTEQQLREAVGAARREHQAGGGTVLDALLRWAGKNKSALGAGLQALGVTVLPPGAEPDYSRLDRQAARELGCVVVADGALGAAWLAMEDPWDDSRLSRVSRRLGRALLPAAVEGERLRRWTDAQATERTSQGTGGKVEQADGPIVSFVDAAIRGAMASAASDIHFECDRSGVTVKHRIDGVMTRYARMQGVQPAQEVISRIKVLAQLDITERRLPQDGRFRFEADAEHGIDLRVSVMPSVFGEDAVLRLLDKAQLRDEADVVSLDRLGFGPAHAELVRDLANEPSGMLLVTGPTGSGKTTTVYAVLSEINTGAEKIITIEDPVEYELPGVLQIPVNERKGLTFAKGLRSILRHDPDRILVGEIRDAETAEIAVQSALTGHLVFTTVHANGVADIMGRFRHFGLDMFGFMSSLNGVVVQRLVRRLCPHCRGQRQVTARELRWLAGQGIDTTLVPQAQGCGQCHHTGYSGRFVLAEVHVVDDELRDLVTQGAPVSALRQHALDRKVESLAMHAARHVARQETTMEEVKRVVGWL